jgi:uncharacterized protein with NRDE domain
MCLILFAYNVHPRYLLVLAANRDEFYERPAAALHFWDDHPQILAGRDLKQMGTWLGVTRNGRLAAITNFRDPKGIKQAAPSRGDLAADFLKGSMGPLDYVQEIGAGADAFNGFNLLIGDRDGLYYVSNRGVGFRFLEPGIYGLSNHLLDTPWPKIRSGISCLESLVTAEDAALFSGLEEVLQNQERPPDDQLPDTGVGLMWERMLAPIFISSQVYGTRCSSILTIARTGQIRFKEISWVQGLERPSPAAVSEFNC